MDSKSESEIEEVRNLVDMAYRLPRSWAGSRIMRLGDGKSFIGVQNQMK